MRYVLRAIPILAALVLLVGLAREAPTVSAQTPGLKFEKFHPFMFGGRVGKRVEAQWANVGSEIWIIVTNPAGVTPDGTTQTTTVKIVADQGDDTGFDLTVRETGAATNIYQGSFVLSAAASANAGSRDDPADVPRPTLFVEDDDTVTAFQGGTSRQFRVEHRRPDISGVTPEHGDAVNDNFVRFTFSVTDGKSEIPVPDDTAPQAGEDTDEKYQSVFMFHSDIQCPDRDSAAGADDGWLEFFDGTRKTPTEIATTVDCDGDGTVDTAEAAGSADNNITVFVPPDTSYTAKTGGFDIDVTLDLGAGTSFVGILVFDKANNFYVFDGGTADEDAALIEVRVDEDDPDLLEVRAGVGWDAPNKQYKRNQRNMLQVIFKDATDLDPASLDEEDFVVEGHRVRRVQWFDVDPEEIAGGPDSGDDADEDGPEDVDGDTKAVCTNAAGTVVLDCDATDEGGDPVAKILRPISWKALGTVAREDNRYFIIRNSVFITLEDDMAPDETPEVYVVPNGVDDEAGNTQDGDDGQADDWIPPEFTLVSMASPRPADDGNYIAGEDDQIELVITSDEELDDDPDVRVTLVNAPVGCVDNGTILDEDSDDAGEQCADYANDIIGGEIDASVREIGSNRWRITINGPDETGYYSISIEGADEEGNTGDLGIAPGDLKDDFFTIGGDVDDDAVRFEGDVTLPKPFVLVGGQDARYEPEVVVWGTELTVTMSFSEPDPVSGDILENLTESEEYHGDAFKEVTVTKFELDGVDFTGQVTTSNNRVFEVAILNVAEGGHRISINAEDAAGNALEEDLETEFVAIIPVPAFVVTIASEGEAMVGDQFFVGVAAPDAAAVTMVDTGASAPPSPASAATSNQGESAEEPQPQPLIPVDEVPEILRKMYGLDTFAGAPVTHIGLFEVMPGRAGLRDIRITVEDKNGDEVPGLAHLKVVSQRTNRNFYLLPGTNFTGLALVPDNPSIDALLTQPVTNVNPAFVDILFRPVTLADVVESIFAFGEGPGGEAGFFINHTAHPCRIHGARCVDPTGGLTPADSLTDLAPYQGMIIKTRRSVDPLRVGDPIVEVFDTANVEGFESPMPVPIMLTVHGQFLDMGQSPLTPITKELRPGFNLIAPHIQRDALFDTVYRGALIPIELAVNAITLKREVVAFAPAPSEIAAEIVEEIIVASPGDTIEPDWSYWTFIARHVDPVTGQVVRPIIAPSSSQ